MASHIPASPKPSRAQHRPQGPEHVPDFKRHHRKCIICHHPQREAIEELFVEWHSPKTISDLFDIDDWFTIYRHAHATGLFLRRRRNLRSALERVIEYAGHSSTTINGIGIVRAVRAYACLTDTGEWIEPATRVIVSRAELHADQPERPSPARRQIQAVALSPDTSALPALPAASPAIKGSQVEEGAARVPARKGSQVDGQSSLGDQTASGIESVEPGRSDSVGDKTGPPTSPAQEGSQVDGESSLGDQTAWGISQSSLGDSAPLISLARVRSGWRPGGRASNRKPPGLETGATHSEQRTATDANRKK
jgi:hypothetical protein